MYNAMCLIGTYSDNWFNLKIKRIYNFMDDDC